MTDLDKLWIVFNSVEKELTLLEGIGSPLLNKDIANLNEALDYVGELIAQEVEKRDEQTQP